MPGLELGLSAPERAILAIDTSDYSHARFLTNMAKHAGASVIKEGLELSSMPGLGWEFCSENAANFGLDWVADAKIHDIPNTTEKTMINIVNQDHPPIAITIHAHSGVDSMAAAQAIASEHGITMLAVTELTSVTEEQIKKTYGRVLAMFGVELDLNDFDVRKILVSTMALDAHDAGIGGLVASAKELVDPIKSTPELAGKTTMLPGTRSAGAKTHDQQNTATPYAAMANGAEYLVIGRQVTESDDPSAAFSAVTDEMQQGINARGGKQ